MPPKRGGESVTVEKRGVIFLILFTYSLQHAPQKSNALGAKIFYLRSCWNAFPVYMGLFFPLGI